VPTEAGAGSGVRLVLATAPAADVAERMVRTLVEERLAACGNIVPGIVSIYRWQGAVQRDAEVMVVLKTTAASVPSLLARLPALHPYQVPEILVVRVEDGNRSYLEWVAAETAGGEVES
jgi:periplasmic divalent cation tolerance protein